MKSLLFKSKYSPNSIYVTKYYSSKVKIETMPIQNDLNDQKIIEINYNTINNETLNNETINNETINNKILNNETINTNFINTKNIAYGINEDDIMIINEELMIIYKIFIVTRNIIINGGYNGIEIIIYNNNRDGEIIIRNSIEIITRIRAQKSKKLTYIGFINKWI